MGHIGSEHLLRAAQALALLLTAYVFIAYVLLPALWTHYEHQPRLGGLPMRTVTAQGIAGDPINVGLVGDKAEVIKSFTAAGWRSADPVTLRTSIEIAGSVLLHRPYADAPVSPLFYAGRRQDLAFEKPVGGSADRRNHIRLWIVLDKGAEDRPVWLGAATFDRGVGFSRYTGQITHHIAPDVDAERDLVIADLARAGMLAQTYQVTGIGPAALARNGGGDPFYTDGEVTVGVLRPQAVAGAATPAQLPSPQRVEIKNAIWSRLKALLPGPPKP